MTEVSEYENLIAVSRAFNCHVEKKKISLHEYEGETDKQSKTDCHKMACCIGPWN